MRLFKGRRYPIKRDENGRSVRQRAFDLFGAGQRPAQVCKTIAISLRTACRYYADFKKLHHRLPYSTIRKWMRENPEFSEKVIAMLATSLEMSQEEVIVRMQKPWGLMEALKGRWPDYGLEREQAETKGRLLAALVIIKFVEIFRQKNPQFVRETLMKIIIEGGAEPPES
ncbi:hypothetical protein ACFLUO_07000 [Chloroflexota bacterium]